MRDGAGQSPVPEPEPLMQSFMLPPGGGDARNYIYQYDAGGNVGQMLDLTPTTWNAAAVMVARYDYDAYGKVVAQAGSFANQATNGNAFQFNTKYLDAETGLNYYGHRYYSARLGRWTTRDPLGEAGGLNLYGFVGNDPVNGIDPLGLATKTWCEIQPDGAEIWVIQGLRLGTVVWEERIARDKRCRCFGTVLDSAEKWAEKKSQEGVVWGTMECGRQITSNVGTSVAATACALWDDPDGTLDRWADALGESAYTQYNARLEDGHTPAGAVFQTLLTGMGYLTLDSAVSIYEQKDYDGRALTKCDNIVHGSLFCLEVVPATRLLHRGVAKVVGSGACARSCRAGTALPRRVARAPDCGAPVSGAQFKTWNQFQAGTKGQFASRAEAGAAWNVYKQANGITTGATRSMTARGQYLRSLADDYRTPSWMKPWLEKGRVPPGYEVAHIKPLSIGGADTPANMRLQGADLHDIHHKFYRPWE